MYGLSEIKHRIKGISETKQITSAMEMISISKMRKSLARYEANQQYFNQIRATIKDIITRTKNVTHRYLQRREGRRAVFIVIASDKGLAGGYNHNVLSMAWESVKSIEEKYVFTVGQVAREFFEAKKIIIDGEFTHLTHDPSVIDASLIVDSLIQLYDQNLMDEAYVIYTAMPSNGVVVPDVLKLLPLEQERMIADIAQPDYKDEDYYREITYDPSPDDVLEQLVPQYLTGVVYGALVQSVASEHSSRRLAMTNATKNATKIIDKLNVVYNRARQETVTKELTEIVNSTLGAEGL